ncbi:hypothetical protein NMY22_g11471 [Coprinellus aureogranulatus]|nr:hypothetical protein NMY22_g11471 [Coprinellus aureogranulatus]
MILSASFSLFLWVISLAVSLRSELVCLFRLRSLSSTLYSIAIRVQLPQAVAHAAQLSLEVEACSQALPWLRKHDNGKRLRASLRSISMIAPAYASPPLFLATQSRSIQQYSARAKPRVPDSG